MSCAPDENSLGSYGLQCIVLIGWFAPRSGNLVRRDSARSVVSARSTGLISVGTGIPQATTDLVFDLCAFVRTLHGLKKCTQFLSYFYQGIETTMAVCVLQRIISLFSCICFSFSMASLNFSLSCM